VEWYFRMLDVQTEKNKRAAGISIDASEEMTPEATEWARKYPDRAAAYADDCSLKVVKLSTADKIQIRWVSYTFHMENCWLTIDRTCLFQCVLNWEC